MRFSTLDFIVKISIVQKTDWGTAKVSNKIQQFQNIALGKITNAPPFAVSNYTLRKDLSIKTGTEEAARFYKNVRTRLQTH